MKVLAEHALNDQFEGEVNLIVVIEKVDVLKRLYESIKKLPSMKKTLVLSVLTSFSSFFELLMLRETGIQITYAENF